MFLILAATGKNALTITIPDIYALKTSEMLNQSTNKIIISHYFLFDVQLLQLLFSTYDNT